MSQQSASNVSSFSYHYIQQLVFSRRLHLYSHAQLWGERGKLDNTVACMGLGGTTQVHLPDDSPQGKIN